MTTAAIERATSVPRSRAGAGLPSQGRHGDHDGACGTDATRAEPGLSVTEAVAAVVAGDGSEPRPGYGPLAIRLMARDLTAVCQAMLQAPECVDALGLIFALEELEEAAEVIRHAVLPNANVEAPPVVLGSLLDVQA